jgi:hypothetical protein
LRAIVLVRGGGMNESDTREEGGWTFFRVLGLIVGLLGMAGFGLCSLYGLPIVFNPYIWTSGGWPLILVIWVPAAALTFVFFLLARAMVRRASGTRSGRRRP